jgi:hypothetical protein
MCGDDAFGVNMLGNILACLIHGCKIVSRRVGRRVEKNFFIFHMVK